MIYKTISTVINTLTMVHTSSSKIIGTSLNIYIKSSRNLDIIFFII